MDGELARLLAVVTHVNVWLENPHGDPPDLFAGNTTFRFVKEMRFELRKRLRTVTWDTTQDWIEGLRYRQIERLLLGARTWRNPDLANIGAAGPGRGAIFTRGSVRPEAWASYSETMWDPTTDYPPDRRIWRVTYRGVTARTPTAPAPATLARSLGELLAALEEIRLFAIDQGMDEWAEWFEQAIQLARSDDPEIPYHPDAIPSDASLERRRVAAAAFQAWVFGGMGSWNDKYLTDPAAVQRDGVVSERLYGAILGCLDAVANA
ncbi:MAG: hypothetical protein ACLGIB_02805 [Actinomycetota bacterium]